jgi:hypothetical protein
LFAGLSKPLDLKLVSRVEFASGAVAMGYEVRRGAGRSGERERGEGGGFTADFRK